MEHYILNPKTEISVVVPLYNEGPNLLAFFEELDGAMTTFGKSYEIIFVNDGSIDNSEKVLTDIAKQNKHTHTDKHNNRGINTNTIHNIFTGAPLCNC